jgi:hypothetical protein
MEGTSRKFFTEDSTREILRRLRSALPMTKGVPEDLAGVPYQAEQIVVTMLSNPELYDRSCQLTIGTLGSQFSNEAEHFSPVAPNAHAALFSLFAAAYRFVCELEFSIPGTLGAELLLVNNFVGENWEKFPQEIRRRLIYANYFLPADVAKRFLLDPRIGEIGELSSRIDTAKRLAEQWDSDLASKKKEVQKLKDTLDNYKSAYNFVGLEAGFRNLTIEKSSEKTLALWSLIALGVVAVLPILCEVYYLYVHLYAIPETTGMSPVDIEKLAAVRLLELNQLKTVLLYALPPLLALEILLFYFFRVVLVHFRSLKTQLLQLQLRSALCQFIQSYAEYAAKLKEQSAGTLAKFESLIFSGLLADEEKLPTTFDGADQIANLFKSFKQ